MAVRFPARFHHSDVPTWMMGQIGLTAGQFVLRQCLSTCSKLGRKLPNLSEFSSTLVCRHQCICKKLAEDRNLVVQNRIVCCAVEFSITKRVNWKTE